LSFVMSSARKNNRL